MRVRAWWNGAGLVLPVSSTRWLPRYGSIRTMANRSGYHGKYVARWKNGQMNSGFDARLVLEERQAGGA